MDKEQAQALCYLAGITILKLIQIPNPTLGMQLNYSKLREEFSWWEIETRYGPITMGYKGQCLTVCWERTPLLKDFAVSGSSTTVSASTQAKFLEYLTDLAFEFNCLPPLNPKLGEDDETNTSG